MEKKDFFRQITSFNYNDPSILNRARQTAENYYEDPIGFIKTIGNAPSPTHLANTAFFAIKANDINLMTALGVIAEASIHHISQLLNFVGDDVAAAELRGMLEDYGHVIDMLNEYLTIMLTTKE